MFAIPERTTAADRRDGSKVVGRRRRTHGPFECPGVPGIVAGLGSLEIRNDEVGDEDQYGDGLDESANSGKQIPNIPAAAGFVGVDAARHTEQAGDVHEIKGEMKADNEQPKMQFAEGLVQHPSRNFWVPIIKCREQGEEDSADDDVMKVSHDKV